MASNTEWLQTNGVSLAAALDLHSEAICDVLTERLAKTYPELCYDPKRIDGRSFQKLAQQRTPQRVHDLIQSALRLQSLDLIKNQYEWAWPIMQRFGVGRKHLLAQVSWYFEVARELATLNEGDRAALDALENAMTKIVKRATAVRAGVISEKQGQHQNGQQVSSVKPKV